MFGGIGPSCPGEATREAPPTTDGKAGEVGKAGDVGAVADAGKQDPCGAAALGLKGAAALTAWTLPSGCTPRGSSGNTIAKNEAELRPLVECGGGSGVDFNKQAVLAVGYSLSPAGVGMAAFDDGKVVTLAMKQRSPCKDDPMPMPMNTTAWFLLPAGGERTFANTVCTVESDCK